MTGKRAKPATPASRSPGRRASSQPNAQVNRQNRKMLGQHYRAKYGVK